MLHHAQILVPLVVKHRQNHMFQFVVKRFGVLGIVQRLIAAVPQLSDGPSGDSLDVPLDPPAIEYAQARHSIQRRLHSAGSARLQRKLRRV